MSTQNSRFVLFLLSVFTCMSWACVAEEEARVPVQTADEA